MLMLGAPVPAAASASGPDQKTATSWASYHPSGWSAGSVARGTGYTRPGASRRVREVQRRLDRLGYPTGKVDGFFGPITDGAVHQYQRENALQADGIVGPRTLHDLRTRTRRGQGSADRETSAAKPSAREGNAQTVVWSTQEAASSPRWWTLVPLLAAAFAIVLVAAGLSLRALSGRATSASRRTRRGTVSNGARPIAESSSEPEIAIRQPKPGTATLAASFVFPGAEQTFETSAIAEEPALAGVTPISSRRRKSRPSRLVASHAGDREPDQLRIVRRIERERGGRSGRAPRQKTATAPRPPSEGGDPGGFSLLGARIHLAKAQAMDSPGVLLVELELFVEGHRGRWVTGILESGSPFRVSLEDLEKSVRDLVVPDYLPALAEALGNGGLEIWPEHLEKLTFAIEPSIEVERAMAERGKAFPIAG
jgi:peptidoglycan hydrolase-like protein with peptidoglycan-binding domain